MLDPKEEKVEGEVSDTEIDKTSESEKKETPDVKTELEAKEVEVETSEKETEDEAAEESEKKRSCRCKNRT